MSDLTQHPYAEDVPSLLWDLVGDLLAAWCYDLSDETRRLVCEESKTFGTFVIDLDEVRFCNVGARVCSRPYVFTE